MKGITFIQVTIVVAIALLSIVSPVHSFVSTRRLRLLQPAYLVATPTSTSSSSWNDQTMRLSPTVDARFRISPQTKKSEQSTLCLYAAKGPASSDKNDKKSSSSYSGIKNMGYNDDAFGLILLIGGYSSQDVDFIATFLTLSVIGAVFSNSKGTTFDTRLPGLVAMATLAITPIVAFVHNNTWAAPQPIEIGLCFVSLVWAFVKWSQEQNE